MAGHDRDDALYGSYEGAEFDAEGNRVRRGGRFAAFNCLPDEISPDAFGGDGIALNWWGGIEGGRYRVEIEIPYRSGGAAAEVARGPTA